MIYEYIRSITAQASDYARELGYLRESIAFEARAQRNWKLWQDHFQNCHNLVLEQTKSLKSGTKVWILGSGSLYETPWKILWERNLKLRLIDIYHPPRVRKVGREKRDIELREVDFTGFRDLSPLQKILLKPPKPPTLPIHPDDFIISSNVWSQLSIFPIQYLSANTDVSTHEKIEWAKNLQNAHEVWLNSFGCRGILFSDFETHLLDSRQRVFQIEQQPLRPAQSHMIGSWDWHWSESAIKKIEAYSISPKTL